MRIISGALVAALSFSIAVTGLSSAYADEGAATDQPTQAQNGPTSAPEEAPTAATAPSESASTDEPAPTPDATVTESPTAKPSPALAPAATNTDQITKPLNGSVVVAGPLNYTVVAGTSGSYSVTLSCDYTYDYEDRTASSPGQQLSGTLDSVEEDDTCTLSLENLNTGATTYSDFTVARYYPTPQIRNLRVAPETFYPRIRDGYKDRARINFGSRLDSDVSVKIVSRSSGRTVRTITRNGRSRYDWYQARSFAWDGRNNAGRTVQVGRYTAVVTSTLGGKTVKDRVPLWVATGHRTRTVTKTRDGWYDSRDSTSGNCYASQHYYPHGNHLDCWGGNYAEARYYFKVPSNATKVRYEVRGKHLCCDNGRLIRDARWLSSTRVQVRVRVTYWRSYVVKRVLLTYRVRERI